MQRTATVPPADTPEAQEPTAAQEADREGRDWVAWYDDLTQDDRRDLRERILTASYDEVKEAPELRTFFLFHCDDLVDEAPPGTKRVVELHHVVMALRGREGEEMARQRRAAVAYLLAEYQAFLRDNPWAV